MMGSTGVERAEPAAAYVAAIAAFAYALVSAYLVPRWTTWTGRSD